ncbi:hypothetical protein ACRQ1B_06050 [Rhizobium panacihumi]|uniref:hypothetical protein n=1 Tax=Rhizobium panacihumi TaxID=2008450 RepID=UPI003D7BF6B4
MSTILDRYYVYRPLLDLIGFTEGTDKGDGYNETLAYGIMLDGKLSRGKGLDVKLSDMSLAELDGLQTRMLADPDNKKLKSSACGRYQIVRTTLRSIRTALPARYPLTRKFDKGCQDEMACYLLGVRGIDKYLAGRLSEDGLINNLAQEWASFPTTAGKGYYGGQHAAVTVNRVRAVLAEVKRRHVGEQPETVAIDKPIVPPAVEKEVRQKSGWLSGVFGGSFSLAGLGTWLAGGIDVKTLLIVVTVSAVIGLAFLVCGEWIVQRIKSIQREIEA